MNLHAVAKYITPKRVLDIGAHFGEFYFEVKSYFPQCECLLIEGNPDCEDRLKTLGVTYHICLLGRENQKVHFYKTKEDPTCTGNSIYKELTKHYNDQNLIVTTLDCHRLDDLNKNKVIFDFVKMDTQGSEIDIFKGGVETLSNAKAIIMETAIKPYNDGAPLQKDVIEYMAQYNFKQVEVVGESRENAGQGDVLQQDILFINESI